jgi:uroporphyrinogen III methyltransferase/synthase
VSELTTHHVRAMGTVYLVGAGPGDPGLLTLRAARLLRRAGVVVHDALVNPRVLDLLPPSAERIDVGKRGGGRRTPQAEINRTLVECARRARVVVRLKGGDPFVYGRGGEEALALREAGVRFRVVPGVTAGVGVPAYAGIPLTHRDLASAVTFVTGHEDIASHESRIDWEHLARTGGTLVVYMGMKRLRRATELLVRGGRDPQTPAAVIEWGSYPHQRTLSAPLAELADRAEAARLRAPALVVIGEVVALRDDLNWYERRPLRGLRAVVPRSRTQPSRLARSLARLGAEVTEFPRLRLAPPEDPVPLRRALHGLGAYHWVVFTSPTAVERFWEELFAEGMDARACAHARFACFGMATSAALERRGIRADVARPSFVPDTAARAMEASGTTRGVRILFPGEEEGTSAIAERLREAGAQVDKVGTYRHRVESDGTEGLRSELDAGAVDVIAFASSSTVLHFVRALGPSAGRATVAAIGPRTAKTARGHGLPVHVVPPEHTMNALIQALHGLARRGESPR